MKVLVLQRGARHRYAIPRLLEEAGMLAALYTDSCAFSTVGRLACGLSKLGIHTRQSKALVSRIPVGVPKTKIYSSDRPVFGKHAYVDYQRWGLQDASVVYSMYGEDCVFLQWAKHQGAKILLDVFVHPETNRIVADEEARILGKHTPDLTIEGQHGHSRRMFELADMLICPSEWVAEGIRKFSPEHGHKIRVVPYGSSVTIAGSINSPKPGRILFAGREPLRKGLHYLAEAAWLLRQDGLQIDVRVAGVKQEEIRWMEHRDELTCLGTVPMEQMRDEYANATVFVLPSLSEGQASVLLEALACGCAVVATRESGIDFEPGGGVMVPARDASALAKALKEIITNHSCRQQLAEGALRQAECFSMDAWKSRLVEGVKSAESL